MHSYDVNMMNESGILCELRQLEDFIVNNKEYPEFSHEKSTFHFLVARKILPVYENLTANTNKRQHMQ